MATEPVPGNTPNSHRSDARYVVVTPARNEETHIGATIRSMQLQTHPPDAWIIVDDGSSDRTAEIVRDAAAHTSWIALVPRPDRGFRAAGGGVVQAFEAGYEVLADTPWDYLVKLDADLTFGSNYFAHCLAAFERDHALGIAGGSVHTMSGGIRATESHPAFHVRGATKIYRRACWESIGGLVEAPGWDTIDELSANMNGWSTRTLDAVPIEQLRATGSAAGQWSNWIKNGRASYLSGYHPLFLLARAVRRFACRPYIVATAGILWGYGSAALRREPKAVGPDLEAYVRVQQMNRLTGRDSIWR